jgi:porin
MDNGVRFDFSLTQTIQGNAAGGKKDEFTYADRGVFGVKLDTGHAGLWPGGMLVIRGEGRYGPDNNPNTGALMPVDMNSLFPVPKQDKATLSELYYLQFLAPWLGVMVGKMSPHDANVFAHDETEQFLNAAFNFHFAPATTIPLGFLGAGLILIPTDWLTITTLVLDSEGRITESGFDTVFKRGTSVAQFWEAKINPFGLPGHQRFGWTWSDKIKVQFQQDALAILGAIITGSTAGLARVGSDKSFFYDFDQYVYLVPGTEDRGLGVFGRFGWGDSEVNPVGFNFSLGIGGKGGSFPDGRTTALAWVIIMLT